MLHLIKDYWTYICIFRLNSFANSVAWVFAIAGRSSCKPSQTHLSTSLASRSNMREQGKTTSCCRGHTTFVDTSLISFQGNRWIKTLTGWDSGIEGETGWWWRGSRRLSARAHAVSSVSATVKSAVKGSTAERHRQNSSLFRSGGAAAAAPTSSELLLLFISSNIIFNDNLAQDEASRRIKRRFTGTDRSESSLSPSHPSLVACTLYKVW